ncbi:MAG: hypothetical protein M1818_006439 [Claussenomyces sp. TS43310]|nr:MAG: hypothetical protein M1818_006439 [Claussenomyces sp. TS43310]
MASITDKRPSLSFVVPHSEHSKSRRLSSMTATKNDLKEGGVVVPPRLMAVGRSKSYNAGFAASLEQARTELMGMNLEATDGEGAIITPPQTTSQSPKTPQTPLDDLPSADTFAFAFDIDGVLVRGGTPIPEAIEAMRVLNGENEYGIKIPYIFLTNGGGKTEAERCIDLSRQLDIEVSPAQFICGHTPMREMVDRYNTVLVIGGEGEKCREVAEGYGFKDVVTPGDIITDNQHTTPFRTLTDQERQRSRKRNFRKTKIEAIFVFADSRDWAGDCQIILDVAMSINGYLGTLSETFDEGPPIYFSHNDIVWSAAHKNVRLGMGALRKIIETLFQELTGKELETIAFGKPQIGTFEFATRLLQQWRKDEHHINAPPDTVYFVGDTPESDIRGTNQFNEKSKNDWYSILVETGVYQPGTEPAHKPRITVPTVLDAVKHGIHRELSNKLKKATEIVESTKEAVPSAIVEGANGGTPDTQTPVV